MRSDHICVGVKRKKHDSLMQVQRIKAAKTHQAKSTIRTEYGMRETENPFLELSLDLHEYITLLSELITIVHCRLHFLGVLQWKHCTLCC